MAVARDVVVGPADAQRRDFRRLFVVSLLGHGALLLVLVWAPSSRMAAPPGVIAIDLVAAPSARRSPARKPEPVAVPAPVAPPKPKPPLTKKVVLPAQPTAPRPKPDPKPAPRARPKPPPTEEPVQEDYTDVIAQLRADAGEETPERQEARPAVTPGLGGSVGRPISPEVAAWIRKAKVHVRGSWVVPPGFRTQLLEAQVMVSLDAQGNVRGKPRLTRRSGNPWYDDSVVRAIQKASPLPAPPEADEWAFVFVPEDSF